MADSSRERTEVVVAALRTALAPDDRVSYAILVGSTARRSDHDLLQFCAQLAARTEAM